MCSESQKEALIPVKQDKKSNRTENIFLVKTQTVPIFTLFLIIPESMIHVDGISILKYNICFLVSWPWKYTDISLSFPISLKIEEQI